MNEELERQEGEDESKIEETLWEPSFEVSTGHHFYLKSFNKPVHCQVCQNFIWGLRKQGLCCEVCGLSLHEKCVNSVSYECYRPKVVEGHNYEQSIEFEHNWLPGNVKIGSKCIVCSKSTQNMSGSFHSLKCSNCEVTVHSLCQTNAKTKCKGELVNLLFCHDLMKQNFPLFTPLLVFVNTKSGGQQGNLLIRKLRNLLTSEQVIDMCAEKGPLSALQKYISVPNLRILVCGGDGTACWVMSVIDKMDNLPEKVPPIAVLPLGTGNDLARVLNFGGGYEGEELKPILRSIIERGVGSTLDRWNLKIVEEDGNSRSFVLNNYFSFGLDAKIALQFHEMREENPQLFKSRTLNKGLYGTFGIQNIITPPLTIKELNFKLVVDGNDIDLSKHEGLECIIFLNIPSYAGGTNVWGPVLENNEDDAWTPCSMNDGKIEVVGLNHTGHLVGIQTKLIHGVRIAQGSSIQFEVNAVEVQVDGEPFRIKNSRVSINFFNRANVIVLRNNK